MRKALRVEVWRRSLRGCNFFWYQIKIGHDLKKKLEI